MKKYLLYSIAAILLPAFISGCQTPVPEAVKEAAPAEPQAEALDLLHEISPVFESSDVKAPGEVVRIAAYNIQNFTDGEDDGYDRTAIMVKRQVAAAAKVIDKVNADILFIEEIENGAILQRLNDALFQPYPVGYVTSFERGSRTTKLNIAVLSRFPLMAVQEVDFGMVKHPARLSRGSLNVQADLGDGHRLLLYGVHLKSNFGDNEDNIAKRKEGLKIIRAHAELMMDSADDVTWEAAILGDTNVDPDLPAFSEDTSFAPIADWIDLFRGMPMPGRNTIPTRFGDPDMQFDDACFDRIFVTPELKKGPWTAGTPAVVQEGVDANIYINPGENETHVSDHYPVYVDLRK